MAEYPKFSIAFNIGCTNSERIEAFKLYKKAFGAVKISQVGPPDWPEVHITIDINGLRVLLAPGGKVEKVIENAVVCEFLFENEESLRGAYDILKEEALFHSIGSYPWAPVGALVTDKYGVSWWLRI